MDIVLWHMVNGLWQMEAGLLERIAISGQMQIEWCEMEICLSQMEIACGKLEVDGGRAEIGERISSVRSRGGFSMMPSLQSSPCSDHLSIGVQPKSVGCVYVFSLLDLSSRYYSVPHSKIMCVCVNTSAR